MQIVGCDFHPSFQQVSILDISTGEVRELKLLHGSGEADAAWSEPAAASASFCAGVSRGTSVGEAIAPD